MARFDEIELQGRASAPDEPDTPPQRGGDASIVRRAIAFIIDLSLFIAAAVALSPVVPEGSRAIPAWIAVGGFLILVSLYYFPLGWMVWGKTIGGAIMDVRVVSRGLGDVNLRQAARRWAGMILSILTLGAGFAPALIGERRTLADRISETRVVTKHEDVKDER